MSSAIPHPLPTQIQEARIDAKLSVTVETTDIPVPSPGQILIRVAVSGTNPKDWKIPKMWFADKPPANHGDDIAGVVAQLGEGVKGFNVGDRVAAFHEMMTPHGSYAEYAIAWDYCSVHIPESTTFEEAATIPLAAMTAALGLYQRLRLPTPWSPATEPTPLVVYGGASAVGAFALKFAAMSNIHPLIVVAGKGTQYVEDLIDRSKGDTIIDYRKGDEAVIEGFKTALGGSAVHHALDAVSEGTTTENISAVLPEGGSITSVLPVKMRDGLNNLGTMVGSVHDPKPPHTAPVAAPQGDVEFGALFFAFIGRGLEQGWFSGHPHEVVPGGLNGVQKALNDLHDGKASAVKYVLRISEDL